MTVDPHPAPLVAVEWVGGPHDGETFLVGAHIRNLVVALEPQGDDLLPLKCVVDIETTDDGRHIARWPSRRQ